jgi:sugar phosphate isomerase/epimerase
MTPAGPLSLNTITVKPLALDQVIEACARHGIPGISPWRDVLQAMGVEKAAKRIRDAGLKVTGLCRGGMFTVGTRADALDDNRRAIAEAHAIGADCLVMVCGGLPQASKDLPGARAIVRDGLAAILPEARAAGVTIALEPLHPMTCADRSVLSTLGQALDLCDELGAGTGVAVDVYHVWWDPDLARQMARAKGRIAGFHVCDWKVPTTDLVFDRGLPGEGVIDIPAIRAMAEAAGWAGGVEVEILSNHWWSQDPEAVIREVKARHAFC